MHQDTKCLVLRPAWRFVSSRLVSFFAFSFPFIFVCYNFSYSRILIFNFSCFLFHGGEETGSESGGKISVSQVLECIEHLDYIIDGEAEDLVRSVVPAALKADSLSLEDVIKVMHGSYNR